MGRRPATERRALSAFERRCLLKHICDCHEALQLTILGAAAAREKGGDAPELERLCRMLELAEAEVAQAEQVAARQLE
jgi:hypothetical protein